jgi:hypothetical protein
MTSRQPETMPDTTGLAAIPGGSEPRADLATAGARHRLVSAPRWPVLVLPLTLLVLVGLAGVRGEITGLQWDGPLHGDPVAVGLALEIVLGIMLVITLRRLAPGAQARAINAAQAGAVAVKLRRVLVFVLSAGMVAVAVTLIVGVHRHLFSGPARARSGQGGSAPSVSAPAGTRPGGHSFFPALHLHVPFAVVYGLLVLIFLGLVAVRVWWARSFRSAGPRTAYRYLGKDSRDLREAVESGRSALYAIDEARAAIIACYVAMETSLADRGAARAIADTPDELLLRATASGIVRGTAAARLTALFYEARFSSHPLDQRERDAAGQALGELAAGLAEAELAEAGADGVRSRGNRRGRVSRSRPGQSGARA